MPKLREPPLPTTQQEVDAMGFWQIIRAIGFLNLEKPVPPPGHYSSVKRLVMKFAGYKKPNTFLEDWGFLPIAPFLVVAPSMVLFFYMEYKIGLLYSFLIITPPAILLLVFMFTVPQVLWFRAGGWEQIMEERTRSSAFNGHEQYVDRGKKIKNILTTTGLILLTIMLPIAVTFLVVSHFVVEGFIICGVLLGLLSVAISSRTQKNDIAEVSDGGNEQSRMPD